MQTNNNQQQQFRVRINQYIRVPQVRVIYEDGSTGGIMETRDALKLAQEAGLDRVERNPKSSPPVVKICNYGKMKYQEKKQQQAAKKNQVIQELKEISFRPNTDENDLNHKLAQAKIFLEEGNKVKFTVKFRGREITHSELGRNKLDWFIQQLQGLITDKSQISLEGKFMWLIISPIRK